MALVLPVFSPFKPPKMNLPFPLLITPALPLAQEASVVAVGLYLEEEALVAIAVSHNVAEVAAHSNV